MPKKPGFGLNHLPPSKLGDLNTYLEIDFFNDAATYNYSPRLRHAYGSWGRFLAGQTWSTFLNVTSLPDHLDFGGSAGSITNLHPIIRWTEPFVWQGIPVEFQASLEAPRSSVWVSNAIAPASSTINANNSNPNTDTYFTSSGVERYPDLVARVNINPEWGNVSLAVMGRQIRYVQPVTGVQYAAWGGSLNVAGKINTFDLDNIRFMAHYGNAQGRMTASANTFSDAAISSQGEFDLTTVFGFMSSYQHWWNKQWRSTVTYGFAQALQADFVNHEMTKQIQSLHANLLWSPFKQTMVGIEYSYATRELINEQAGHLHRVQFSARYNF